LTHKKTSEVLKKGGKKKKMKSPHGEVCSVCKVEKTNNEAMVSGVNLICIVKGGVKKRRKVMWNN